MERVVRLAALTVSRSRREVRLEEWLADLAGCEELGIRPRQVALGALMSAMTYRPAPPEGNESTMKGINDMNEQAKGAIRLALYAVWVVMATVWTWIIGTHLSVSGTNLGFNLPGGPIVDITVALLIAGITVGALGLVLGYRSFRHTFYGAPEASAA